MDPAETYRRQVPVSQLTSFFTPTESVYVIAHMGVAHVPVDGWELRIEGAVERPLHLTYAELLRRPAETIEGVLECFGNPVEPDVATRRVGNVSWRGARLWPLLEEAGVQPRASLAWLEAPDHGVFAGTPSERYIKDVPLEIVRERPVLLAWEMNGAPITPEHGFPVRAVVPGFFGTNSVKWLSRIYLADTRPESLFTTRLYNRRVAVNGREQLEPVRDLDVHSVIVAPAEGDALAPGAQTVEGWAWSAGPVRRVEVSVDGGATWQEARLEARRHGYVWQRFTLAWTLRTPGSYRLECRAMDEQGRMQPPTGRNRIHAVNVTVT
jgi:DMSO/TMAO reductase YedYZ molybdopterin-dependent catalytic subunit